jgi:hypothetical protein
LEAEGLELDDGRHITKRTRPLDLVRSRRHRLLFFIWRRATAILRRAGLIRAGIDVIGNAIAIPVRATGRTASILWVTWLAGAHIPVIGNSVAIGIGTSLVLGQAGCTGATVLGIGDAVAVGILVATAARIAGATAFRHRAAAILGRPPLVGALILAIAHAIAVPIRAAPGGRDARLVGAHILVVGETIAVPVAISGHRAAALGRAGIVGAGVLPIRDGVAVPIRAAIHLGRTCLIRAGVVLVRDLVAVAVAGQRTAIEAGHAGHVGAGVLIIGDGIAIPIAFGGRWATSLIGRTCLIRACVLPVRDVITVPVGTTTGGRPSRLIRAGVDLVGHAISISVAGRGGLHSLHIDRGLDPRAIGAKGPGDQCVCPGRERLPGNHQWERRGTAGQGRILRRVQLAIDPQLDAHDLAIAIGDGVDHHRLPHRNLFSRLRRSKRNAESRLGHRISRR